MKASQVTDESVAADGLNPKNSARRCGVAWIWAFIVAGGVLYASIRPPNRTPSLPPATTNEAPAPAAPIASTPPAPMPAELLAEAKRVLLLAKKGRLRSRDAHAKALNLLDQIPNGSDEYDEASTLGKRIRASYRNQRATAPAPSTTESVGAPSAMASAPATPTSTYRLPALIAGPLDQILNDSDEHNEALTLGKRIRASYGNQRATAAAPFTTESVSAPRAPVAAPAVPTSTYRLPVLNAAPLCAENGSCYGDMSDATGKPKTVHVPGYTRSNGTYVRGYYRSK